MSQKQTEVVGDGGEEHLDADAEVLDAVGNFERPVHLIMYVSFAGATPITCTGVATKGPNEHRQASTNVWSPQASPSWMTRLRCSDDRMTDCQNEKNTTILNVRICVG